MNINKNLILVTSTANIFEWYEFSIVGFFATILGKVFFNFQSIFISTICGLSIFIISYLIRPIGGLYWSMFIIRYGSNQTMRASIFIMSIPTAIIGLLPAYNAIGIISTIILILLRVIHGFGAGGELPVNATYIVTQPLQPHQKTIFCSLLNCSAIFGILLASLTTFILHKLFSKTEIIHWAWRIPFLISIPIFFVIYLIRKYIPTQNITILHNIVKKNTRRYNVTSIFKIILFIAFIQVTFYIMFMWLPSYLPTFINITAYYTQYINTISLFVLICFTILFGVICSKLKPSFIIKIGIILTVFSTILFFTCVTPNNVFVYLILFSTSFALVQASFLPILANMCHGNYYETKLILSFSLGTALFGSTAPLLCTYLLHKFNLSFFPSIYISILGILSLFTINKTSH